MRNGQAFLLVYDICDATSFGSMCSDFFYSCSHSLLISEIPESVTALAETVDLPADAIPLVLVGTKLDKASSSRQVSEKEGKSVLASSKRY